jgi:hypothetical protein
LFLFLWLTVFWQIYGFDKEQKSENGDEIGEQSCWENNRSSGSAKGQVGGADRHTGQAARATL